MNDVAARRRSRSGVDERRQKSPPTHPRHNLAAGEIDDLVDILSIQAEVLEPVTVAAPALRDVADLPVLGTLPAAVQVGTIDYLVTGDKDLLALAGRYPGMYIP